MSALIALENERDPCLCRSPETLPDSVSPFPDIFPSVLRRHDRRSLSVDTLLEIPSGTAMAQLVSTPQQGLRTSSHLGGIYDPHRFRAHAPAPISLVSGQVLVLQL